MLFIYSLLATRAVAAVLGTGVGLYTVINQDFGHGHHDDDHKAPLTSEQQNVSEEKREEKEASPEPNTKGEADESKKAPADPAEADPVSKIYAYRRYCH